ncbi:MAG: discoidin domain-containing protein, partial [Bacteroidaceae bacterium]|nr:discoidin domain-containing protein [Bacteroidaceae bacterium]
MCIGTTLKAQVSFSVGERKSTFADGDKVIIFSTCMVNGTSEYTAIFNHSGTNASLEQAMPNEYYMNDGTSVWEVEVLDGSTDEQPKLAFKPYGATTYWGIGGVTSNSSVDNPQTYYLVNYANRVAGGTIVEGVGGEWCGTDVWGLDTDFNPVAPADVTAEHNLFAVVAGTGKSLNTANDIYQTGRDAAYPIAFYEALEANYAPESTGDKGGDGRKMTSFKVGDKVYNLTSNEQSLKYVDKTDVAFLVAAGSDVKAVMTHNASWMHSFVYIDEDKNGFTAGVADDGYTPTGDLVSYSFYTTNTTDTNGYNSAGTPKTGNARNTLELPEFKAPERAGIYRLRAKYDWCSIDPSKSVGPDGAVNPNLAIVDFTLKVISAEDYEKYTSLKEEYSTLEEELMESFQNITLTTEEGQPGYIWTNAQSTQEGPLANLIDGIVGSSDNYFHTAYGSQTEASLDEHYFEIDLGEGDSIQHFYFDYTTRENSQALANIPNYCKILGSNDKQNYDEIIVIDSGMPQNNNTYYKSAIISANREYRYLRFIMKQNNKFFHLAEFDLYKLVDDKFIRYLLNTEVELDDYDNLNVETVSSTFLNSDIALELYDGKKMLDTAGFSKNKVALTIEEGQPGYIRTNAATTQEHNDQSATRGDLSNLIDGLVGDDDINSYFHTGYGTNITTAEGYHFLEIDLGENNSMQSFQFDYATRKGAAAHFPQDIYVMGSNNGVDFSEITHFGNLPQTANVMVEPEIVIANEAYRYLRFKVNSTETFFHMAEFNLYRIDYAAEYANKTKGLSAIHSIIEDIVEDIADISSMSVSEKENLLADISLAKLLPTDDYFALNDCVEAVKAKNYTSSNVLGAYSIESLDNLNTVISNAEAALETYDSTVDYAAIIENLLAAEANLKRNGENKYYHIKGYNNSDAYMIATAEGSRMKMNIAPDPVTAVFYLNHNSQLISYKTGTGIKESYNCGTYSDTPEAITFTELEGVENGYIMNTNYSGSKTMYHHLVNSETGEANVDRQGTLAGDRTSWIVEEVTSLPVTVTNVGWASFYAPVDVKVPENVNAYIINGVKNEEAVKLTKVSEIPANNGVILEAPAGTYYFEITENLAPVEENWLTGTVATTVISGEAYVLGKPADREVGLYPAALTDGNFVSYSHKAYLPASLVPEGVQGSNSFSFRFDDGFTTGVENVDIENAPEVIYTIGGTRVNSATLPGLYIVNGKKVYV